MRTSSGRTYEKNANNEYDQSENVNIVGKWYGKRRRIAVSQEQKNVLTFESNQDLSWWLEWIKTTKTSRPFERSNKN